MNQLLLIRLENSLSSLIGESENIPLAELYFTYKIKNPIDRYGINLLRFIIFNRDMENTEVLEKAVEYFEEKRVGI